MNNNFKNMFIYQIMEDYIKYHYSNINSSVDSTYFFYEKLYENERKFSI